MFSVEVWVDSSPDNLVASQAIRLAASPLQEIPACSPRPHC